MKEKVNNIVTRIAEAEAKISASKCDDIQVKIERRLNYRDQTSFLNDLEITGLDELANENPIYLITIIAQKVGISLDECDIVSAGRKGKRRSGDVINGEGAVPRPQPLVVRLARRTLRDQLIRAARSRPGVDTAGIVNTVQSRRFYINEPLNW
ncbi:unnamed protein product [Parnassius apollo]|uniref:(apollo) hypothetical protein n=1 Tax=Parnassius apollo TaxID=110799 RepID=A0A8S3XSW6_PARAO|nr:unnamed protein product [Parnassius apollo]